MAHLLSESFTRHDPPAVAVDLTPEEFEAFVSLWSPAAGAEGLTIVARDVATRRLAGALLTDDFASPSPQDWTPSPRSSIRSSIFLVRSTRSTGPKGPSNRVSFSTCSCWVWPSNSHDTRSASTSCRCAWPTGQTGATPPQSQKRQTWCLSTSSDSLSSSHAPSGRIATIDSTARPRSHRYQNTADP